MPSFSSLPEIKLFLDNLLPKVMVNGTRVVNIKIEQYDPHMMSVRVVVPQSKLFLSRTYASKIVFLSLRAPVQTKPQRKSRRITVDSAKKGAHT